MRTAHPLGLSPDGRNLIVVIDGGEQVSIPADERLRAALRNDRARMGQLEIDMESALRPRDIQARIRAGESLEAVAQAAGVPIERIEPFAAPVIAERDHIAGLAQTNPVRRAGDAVAHRSLRSVVSDRLLSRGVDIDSVEWDAWRTEDRRWTVRLSYESGSAHRQADFSYDQTGRFSTAANDDARWLTGEQSGSHGPQPGRKRRGDPDNESTLDLNDELAIVRAIQPQFEVTPDVEDDLDDEIEDDEILDDAGEEGSPDNEDAFTEGDLAEVDGVYDIVPRDRSSMDVLYDMLSSFDEDSVQIYAGLVRPRPEESAAPVLDEGPAVIESVELVAERVEIDYADLDEPTQRIEDELDDEREPADEELTEAELAFAEPSPAALAEVTDDDAVLAASEAPDEAAPEAVEVTPATDESVAAEDAEAVAAEDAAVVAVAAEALAIEEDDLATDDADAEPTEPAEAWFEEAAEVADSGEAEDSGGAADSGEAREAEDGASASDEEDDLEPPSEPAAKPRPGKIKPSPAEPEQPSLVDEAANEPSRPIKRKRASVPSWDEIMFGAPKPKE